MAVNGGAGNAISFSEIQAFYGGSDPISISEYARGGDNVPSSFAGASTATTGTSSQTVDDFAVTVTEVDGSLVNLTTSGSNQADAPFPISTNAASFTLLNTTSFVNVVITGNGTCTFFVNNSQIGSVSPDGSATGFTIRGPQFVSGDRTLSVNTAFSAGDVFSLSCTQGSSTNTSTHGVRAIEYDITFQNNNSTGDTYNLTSNSTGGSSKTAYAAGDSFLAQNNGSSNQFVLAYDNVTGSGPGTAGDINVTETSAFTGSLDSTATVRSQNSATTGSTVSTSYTVTASDAAIFITGGGLNHVGGEDQPEGTGSHSATRNGNTLYNPTSHTTTMRYRGPASDGTEYSGSTFYGSLSTGDVLVITATVGTISGSCQVSTARRAAQYTTKFTNSSGSKSYTLGGSSTGGAATLAAGATRNAQTTNSSNSNWEVHFDTSSGNCNTNIPTTISSGNSVNLDLFNAPGTPVG